MTKLQTELVVQQRIFRQAQKDFEIISSQNSNMENEFKAQTLKKNKENQEHGEFIRATNNIYDICIEQFHDRGKQHSKYGSSWPSGFGSTLQTFTCLELIDDGVLKVYTRYLVKFRV